MTSETLVLRSPILARKPLVATRYSHEPVFEVRPIPYIAYMFAGIVEYLGKVARIESRPPGQFLVVDAGPVAEDAQIGASIAINGCCLTVVAREGPELGFDAGPETLARTNLGKLVAGSRVNLERSLTIGDRLGGHFVTGHIDSVGSPTSAWMTRIGPLAGTEFHGS